MESVQRVWQRKSGIVKKMQAADRSTWRLGVQQTQVAKEEKAFSELYVRQDTKEGNFYRFAIGRKIELESRKCNRTESGSC